MLDCCGGRSIILQATGEICERWGRNLGALERSRTKKSHGLPVYENKGTGNDVRVWYHGDEYGWRIEITGDDAPFIISRDSVGTTCPAPYWNTGSWEVQSKTDGSYGSADITVKCSSDGQEPVPADTVPSNPGGGMVSTPDPNHAGGGGG